MKALHRTLAGLSVVGALLVVACGGSSGGAGGGNTTILIGLDVPSSGDPYAAGVITRGAQLAVDEENAAGGVRVHGGTYALALKTYDDGGQPAESAANVTSAIHDGAVAVIEDGLGATISASPGEAAGIPEIDITNGDLGLMDPRSRPSLFRLGIPNDAAAGLLATYVKAHTSNVAIIHDDSENGRDGSNQLAGALMTAGANPTPVIEVPASAPSLDAQTQEVRAAGVGGIALWGSDLFIGKAVAAIRAAGVLTTIYAGPSGESPAVRAIAGSAATEGMRIVTSRMTSEGDDTSFPSFEHALAKYHLGPTDAGFKNAAGQEIRQPNDVDFFSYDAVHLIVAALKKQGSVQPGRSLVADMSVVMVKSANGDARGFDPQSHEAFAAADVYIAGVHDMQFEPVKDEELSATLPTEDEILADFH